MITETKALQPTVPALKPATANVLQRACACGQHAGNGGECAECRKKRLGLQRRAVGHGPETAPPIVHEVLRSPGRPLDEATRGFMESRFGHDFSGVQAIAPRLSASLVVGALNDPLESEADHLARRAMRAPAVTGRAAPAALDFSRVRVHTDTTAAESARAVDALAYTVGEHVVFGAGQYAPGTSAGRALLAHELVHVMQQSGGAAARTTAQPTRTSTSGIVQRAGDPSAIPAGFACPTDLTAGRPAGTDLLFSSEATTLTPAHAVQLTAFVASWTAAGGTDDILVHGYASTDGDQALNWTLSCTRAEVVQAELIRLGIPAVRISIVAHGESTDFGAGAAANRHVVISRSAGGVVPLPLVTGTLTARDNFAGRSTSRFGVGETIDLNFASLPARPPADFGGLQWVLAAGGGTLTAPTADGTGTYVAPATADTVRLELRVATGATAGRVISSHTINIVLPNGVRMTVVPGSPPGFTFAGQTPAGTWGVGFQANVFIDPRDVSFQGVVFGEGTVTAVVTPPGSFLSPFAGAVHPVNTFGPAHGGNATTGTPVSPPVDNIFNTGLAPTGSLLGVPTCGTSDFLWAIPWEFSVAGGARTPFATANHHVTSTFLCDGTIEKGGAGTFCRRLNGTTC